MFPPVYFTGTQMAAPAGADWIDFGGNSFDQRFSTLSQITTANVSDLKVAWHTHLYSGNGPGIAQSTGGIVYRGVLYIATGTDDVFALDATTGEQLWSYQPHVNYANATGGKATRGLAIGGGLVFLGRQDNVMVALDAATGGVAWQTTVDSAKLGYYMTGAPEYYNGKVIEGIAGGENGIRGYVQAFNAIDGSKLWRSYMIPAPGEPGSTTWAPGSDWQHGGAPVWTHPIVDPSLNLVYVTTGNAAPYANRPPGDNLYTASAVALNADSGAIVWYYQTVHHDTWDDDIASSAVLFDEAVDGQTVKAIDIPTKMGLNFILDRTNGKPVIPTPEVSQPQDATNAPGNSPTQPIPGGTPFSEQCATAAEWVQAGGDPSLKGPDGQPITFGCIYTPIVPQHYTVPGWHDVADWPPHAFNVDTGLMYICSTNNRGDAYEAVPIAKANNVPGQNYTANVSKLAGDWVAGKWGVVTAIDPAVNGIRWQAVLPDSNGCYSGLATTAGGVVFVGEASGHELAYDAQTGKLLWTSDQLDASVGAPPITYQGSDGQEYMAVLVGGTAISAKAIHGDSVYAFALPKQ